MAVWLGRCRGLRRFSRGRLRLLSRIWRDHRDLSLGLGWLSGGRGRVGRGRRVRPGRSGGHQDRRLGRNRRRRPGRNRFSLAADAERRRGLGRAAGGRVDAVCDWHGRGRNDDRHLAGGRVARGVDQRAWAAEIVCIGQSVGAECRRQRDQGNQAGQAKGPAGATAARRAGRDDRVERPLALAVVLVAESRDRDRLGREVPTARLVVAAGARRGGLGHRREVGRVQHLQGGCVDHVGRVLVVVAPRGWLGLEDRLLDHPPSWRGPLRDLGEDGIERGVRQGGLALGQDRDDVGRGQAAIPRDEGQAFAVPVRGLDAEVDRAAATQVGRPFQPTRARYRGRPRRPGRRPGAGR